MTKIPQNIPPELEGWDLDNYFKPHTPLLVGMDEVGRGSLAGPVVTCALSLKDSAITNLKNLNDSKKLSAKKRESLFGDILEHTKALGLGVGLCIEIDHINIYKATKLAMYRALENLENSLSSKPSGILLVDGLFLPHPNFRSYKVIKGDTKSPHIMAASIIAKVVRDQLMDLYDKEYPNFGFAKHKGYGTSFHRQILSQKMTDIHRKTFAPLKNLLNSDNL